MRFFLWMAFVAGFLASAADAEPPSLMKHQGRIAVSGVNHDGLGYFKFALVDGTATQTFWTNDGTTTGEPAAALEIQVTKGHYAILLGDTTIPNMILPMTGAIFAEHDEVHLRVWFASASSGPFHLLSPDRRITTAAYAFSASHASITPGYETGTGAALSLQSVSGNNLRLAASFTESFLEVPSVAMDPAWAIGATSGTGFAATAAFEAQTLDGPQNVGTHTSLAVINGRPAIAYRNDSSGDLMYLRALDASGKEWLMSSIVRVAGEFVSDVGLFASLLEIDGRPAIAYYDSSQGDLKFVRANDVNGASWPTNAITVDGLSSNVGHDVSLAIVGGKPAIAYQAPNTGEILYAWADDAAGLTWNKATVEGSFPGAYRQQPSLADLGGKPAIAFFNQTDGGLRYAWLSGSDPEVQGDWSFADADASGGQKPSLAVVDGHPAVAHDDGTIVRFVRATDAAGSAWGAAVTVGTGAQPSLAGIGGLPMISYQAAGDLKLAVAADATGSSWPVGNLVTVDGGAPNVGSHSSLSRLAGLPAIAYHDASGKDLKIASLPVATWSARAGGPEPILASGVKDGAVTEAMLTSEIGVWKRSGDDLVHGDGRVGIGRVPVANTLEVEGTASKTTAGLWAANSDRRIKTNVREVGDALTKILALRLVDFEYTENYRAAHPTIDKRRYPNVIAQEFAEVFPEAVTASGESIPGDSDPIQQVDAYPILIYSAAAIQEMALKLQAMDEENALLNKRLKSLETKIELLNKRCN